MVEKAVFYAEYQSVANSGSSGEILETSSFNCSWVYGNTSAMSGYSGQPATLDNKYIKTYIKLIILVMQYHCKESKS